MFLKLATNFCILFTFTVLSYWPFQDHVRIRVPFPKLHPLMIGLMAGFAGTILMKTSVPVSDDVFVDARTAVIVISGIFGGPGALLVSALIIGVSRFLIDGATVSALVAGMNVIIASFIIVLFSINKPMTFRNAPYYFYYLTLQTVIVLIFLMGLSWDTIIDTFYFIVFSFISFFTVLVILREMNVHFRKIRQIEALSKTDHLTGLNNNRKFQEISAFFSEADKGPFSVIVLDIDHFKKVNDTYGHPIGDEVLIELSSRLRREVSSIGGPVSRIGGEEFAMILPGFDKETAKKTAEKIRLSIAERPFVTSTNNSIPVTISVGISSSPQNGKLVKELYNLADKAMYIAKQTGRNKVVHIDDLKEKSKRPHRDLPTGAPPMR